MAMKKSFDVGDLFTLRHDVLGQNRPSNRIRYYVGTLQKGTVIMVVGWDIDDLGVVDANSSVMLKVLTPLGVRWVAEHWL